jgi:peptidoglycan/LPS O-acetylase OafA/YrhL
VEAGRDRRRRIGALDGVRGLAVVAVVLFHAFPDLVPGGFFGVEVFFVLSGFLLARLLLSEHRTTGGIDIGAFALRRLRRIAPALWLLLVVLVLVAPLVARDDAHRLPGDVAWSALGLTNWHLVAEHSSYFAQLGRPPFVRHLWSIAVEVQFYVVCPFLVLWAARCRRWTAVAGLGAAVAGSAGLMAVLAAGADPSRSYYGTDTRVGALLSGVLLALLVGEMTSDRQERMRRFADPVAVAGFTVLGGLCWWASEDRAALYPMGFLAVQAATAALIVGAVAGSASRPALASLPLRWLGERSYGIYLWHWPLVALLRPGIDVGWDAATAGLVGIAGAVALGHLSYTLVERPLLRGGRPRMTGRLPDLARPLAAMCAVLLVAGVAGVVTHLPKRDPIADSLRAGEMVLSAQAITRPVEASTTTSPPATSATTRARPAPTTTVRPAAAAPARRLARAPAPTAAPAPPPLPAGPAPGTVTVTAIGDSVMLGAAGPLKARLGETSAIDAKVSRQFRDGVALVASLRQEGRLAPVVVVHLGTNGPPTPADVDAMMAAAAAARVLLVTVRVNRSWSDETNAVLTASPARHPKAALVDWSAHSTSHPEWFHSDGIHLTPAGADAYAALIGSSLPPPTATTPTTLPPVTPTTTGP